MAFGNNRKQNNRINTTTKVIQVYNAEGEDAGTLTLGYWNQFATIKINPALSPDKREDNKMYNYDVNASVVLGAETVIALNTGIAKMEALIKAKKSPVSVAVRAGQYVVKVGPNSDYEGLEGDFYVGLFEVDNKGVSTGSMLYPFVAHNNFESTIMFNWNEDNGKAKKVSHNTQWKSFKNFLKKAEEDLVSGGAHGALTQIKVWTSKLSDALEVMKNLVETVSLGGGRSSGNSSSGQGQNGFNSGGFSQRRKRNMNVSGEESDAGSSGEGRSRGNSRKAPKEEVTDDISDIENEMMDEIDDLDDM